NLTTAGFSMGAKTTLSQFRSTSQPSLAVNPQNNQILMSWATATPVQHIAFATSGNGATWALFGLSATSSSGPSGFAVASPAMPNYWMAWTGTDPARSMFVRNTQNFTIWP